MGKRKEWLVSVGFATGSPQNKNASWFAITDIFFGETKEEAIRKARLEGYRANPDICADWLFSCEMLKHSQNQ